MKQNLSTFTLIKAAINSVGDTIDEDEALTIIRGLLTSPASDFDKLLETIMGELVNGRNAIHMFVTRESGEALDALDTAIDRLTGLNDALRKLWWAKHPVRS